MSVEKERAEKVMRRVDYWLRRKAREGETPVVRTALLFIHEKGFVPKRPYARRRRSDTLQTIAGGRS